MFSIEELAFAVKYPFTKKARQIIKDYDISVEKITEEQLEKAVQRLSLRKNQVEFNSIEFMVEELQFFALEKLLLSLSNNNSLKKSFAKQIASNSTNHIKKNDEKKALQLIESILEEYGVKTGFINGFYAIPLIDFLKASYFSESLNLVHQRVDKGKVILSYNALLLFLEYYLVNRMINSMESAIPKELLNNNIKKAIIIITIACKPCPNQWLPLKFISACIRNNSYNPKITPKASTGNIINSSAIILRIKTNI